MASPRTLLSPPLSAPRSLWRLEESTTTTPPHPQDGIHTPYNRGPGETRSLHLVQGPVAPFWPPPGLLYKRVRHAGRGARAPDPLKPFHQAVFVPTRQREEMANQYRPFRTSQLGTGPIGDYLRVPQSISGMLLKLKQFSKLHSTPVE